MGQRDPRIGRDRDPRADAGDHLERDFHPSQREGLLPSTAEDEWVASLEPGHRAPRPRLTDQDRVDLLLGAAVAAVAFACIDPRGARPTKVEETLVHQGIVDDDVHHLQTARSPYRG